MSDVVVYQPPGRPPAATKADSDRQLLESWIASLNSVHSRGGCRTTGTKFVAALACPLRAATIEDVRDALGVVTQGVANSSARQYTLRVKSLLTYAHKLGYTVFNAGAAIKPPREVRALAKRIVGELDVRDLIRSAKGRDYLIAALLYASGIRVSELVGLNVGDVIKRNDGCVQLHVLGKGGKEREVLLDASFTEPLAAACADRLPGRPLFVTHSRRRRRDPAGRLTARAINHVVKKLARRARLTSKFSPHWLRHAHASHAIDHGASLPVVAATLGHASIATTSVYLHAKPNASSSANLNPEIWKQKT